MPVTSAISAWVEVIHSPMGALKVKNKNARPATGGKSRRALMVFSQSSQTVFCIEFTVPFWKSLWIS